MTNMFQQDSACRKQKNVTCLVNITLPTSCTDSSRGWKCKDQLHYRHRALLKAVPALPTLGNAAERQEKPQRRKRTHMQRRKEKKKRTDELSDEGGIKPRGRGGCKLQKGFARSQPPPKTTGEATNKGKMSLHEDSEMCSETQTGKILPFLSPLP